MQISLITLGTLVFLNSLVAQTSGNVGCTPTKKVVVAGGASTSRAEVVEQVSIKNDSVLGLVLDHTDNDGSSDHGRYFFSRTAFFYESATGGSADLAVLLNWYLWAEDGDEASFKDVSSKSSGTVTVETICQPFPNHDAGTYVGTMEHEITSRASSYVSCDANGGNFSRSGSHLTTFHYPSGRTFSSLINFKDLSVVTTESNFSANLGVGASTSVSADVSGQIGSNPAGEGAQGEIGLQSTRSIDAGVAAATSLSVKANPSATPKSLITNQDVFKLTTDCHGAARTLLAEIQVNFSAVMTDLPDSSFGDELGWIAGKSDAAMNITVASRIVDHCGMQGESSPPGGGTTEGGNQGGTTSGGQGGTTGPGSSGPPKKNGGSTRKPAQSTPTPKSGGESGGSRRRTKKENTHDHALWPKSFRFTVSVSDDGLGSSSVPFKVDLHSVSPLGVALGTTATARPIGLGMTGSNVVTFSTASSMSLPPGLWFVDVPLTGEAVGLAVAQLSFDDGFPFDNTAYAFLEVIDSPLTVAQWQVGDHVQADGAPSPLVLVPSSIGVTIPLIEFEASAFDGAGLAYSVDGPEGFAFAITPRLVRHPVDGPAIVFSPNSFSGVAQISFTISKGTSSFVVPVRVLGGQ